MLAWVNDCLATRFANIEELRSGSAYCQLMDKLFPGIVSMNRIKYKTKLEHEYIQNFKILQEAFDKVGVDKVFTINKMIKGYGNYEFMQWFKKFYDANNLDADYDPTAPRRGKQIGNASVYKARYHPSSPPAKVGATCPAKQAKSKMSSSSCRVSNANQDTSNQKVHGSKVEDFITEFHHLKNTENELKKVVEKYLGKLKVIEFNCHENYDKQNPIVKQILEVLYSTKDGLGSAVLGENERDVPPRPNDNGNDTPLSSEE
jgi:RP/EB family microtubule-associated protein